MMRKWRERERKRKRRKKGKMYRESDGMIGKKGRKKDK